MDQGSGVVPAPVLWFEISNSRCSSSQTEIEIYFSFSFIFCQLFSMGKKQTRNTSKEILKIEL